MVLQVTSKFGEIDRNLHSHPFDDVICKPPVPGSEVPESIVHV